MKLTCFIAFVYIITFASPLLVPGLKIDKTLPFVVGGMGILYQLIFNRKESFSSLGLTFSDTYNYFQVLCIVSSIMLIVGVVGVISGKLHLEMPRTTMLLKILINIPLLTILITPLAIFTEELVFRGIIQRQLTDYMPPLAALLTASIIFGIWHVPFGRSFGLNAAALIMYVLGTAMVGILAGVFYHHSKSLIVAGFLHGLWNAISYTVFGMGTEMPRILQSDNDMLTHPEQGLTGVCILTCAVAVTLFLKRM